MKKKMKPALSTRTRTTQCLFRSHSDDISRSLVNTSALLPFWYVKTGSLFDQFRIRTYFINAMVQRWIVRSIQTLAFLNQNLPFALLFVNTLDQFGIRTYFINAMVQRWIVGSIQTLAFLNQFFFRSFTHCIENALYVLDNDSRLDLT